MDFSLFDEAARDYDAENAVRRTAMVRSAVQEEIFPFLALASSAQEYGHRKALAAERLTSIAQRCGSSLAETEGVADRMYGLLAEGRQRTAQLHATAAAACANCGHKGTDHTEGLRCQCGCTDYTPKTDEDGGTKEAHRVTAQEGSGPFS